jgi:hypothetical protein
MFDNYMLLVHAAIQGQGIALCGGRLADELIRRHELIRPFETALRSEFSFYLMEPSQHRPRRQVSKSGTGFCRTREWRLPRDLWTMPPTRVNVNEEVTHYNLTNSKLKTWCGSTPDPERTSVRFGGRTREGLVGL